ncbi:hypothetical protein NQ315_013548 [Exocentrus adspersus]|uniref:Uncharacterized protein n=1 Tax=Exocentrus adspersus TaxID=1586481 RepID=A0AAV8V544_9CUCU|nr:hypothetical protein NQ315_013548 [Exocentrus adspersus]
MDPAVYMQGVVNGGTLAGYLGIDGRNTPELRAHHQQQGIRFLEHFQIIPRRDTPANCPECNAPLRTTVDRERHGWRYVCSNHPTRKRFSALENTFLAKTRLYGEFSADKLVRLLYAWYRRVPLDDTLTDLSISSETGVYWYGFCRDVACAIAWHDFVPIGGAGDVVEQCIDEESYVCTDYWLAYAECEVIFNGYGRVNHSENFVYPPKREKPLWMPAGRFNQECLDHNWDGPPPVPGNQPFRVHTQNIEKSLERPKESLEDLK